MSDMQIQLGCPLFKREVDTIPKPVRIVGVVAGIFAISIGTAFLAGAFAIGQADLIGGLSLAAGFLIALPLLILDCKRGKSQTPSSTTQAPQASTLVEESSSSDSSSTKIQNKDPSNNRLGSLLQNTNSAVNLVNKQIEGQKRKATSLDKKRQKQLPALKSKIEEAISSFQNIQELAAEKGVEIGEDYTEYLTSLENRLQDLPHPASSSIEQKQFMVWDSILEELKQKRASLAKEIQTHAVALKSCRRTIMRANVQAFKCITHLSGAVSAGRRALFI